MLIKINPKKLIEQRGQRKRREIAELSKGKISEMNLSYWESGDWQPSPKKIPHLLKALGCKLEDIAEPIELGLN